MDSTTIHQHICAPNAKPPAKLAPVEQTQIALHAPFLFITKHPPKHAFLLATQAFTLYLQTQTRFVAAAILAALHVLNPPALTACRAQGHYFTTH